MLFASFIGCLESIATLGEGATAGAIQKMNPHLSVGQIKRCLAQLEAEGYVHHKIERYGRTGKKVYYLSNRCVTNLGILNTIIDRVGYRAEEVS